MKEEQQNKQKKVFGLNLADQVIPFIQMRWVSLTLSLILILSGAVLFVMKGGFTLGIDFQGGVKMETRFTGSDVGIQKLRESLKKSGLEAEVTTIGNPTNQSYLISLPVKGKSANDVIVSAKSYLASQFGENSFQVEGSEMVEAKIGAEFGKRALYLVLLVAALILIYVIFRFDFFYGVGAVGALFHDMLIMMAFALFFNIPIDMKIVAAFLTILGYSINDTIVIFDRIRETVHHHAEEEIGLVMNKAITQTLNRTIITTLTTISMVIAFYIFGGLDLKDFAFMLIVGMVSGVYSTIFIASPITYMLKKSVSKSKGKKPQVKTTQA